MKVDSDSLVTIKNFAQKFKVTPSYIYKLIKEKKMESFSIDGIQFIDTTKFSAIPARAKG